ncbi:MAG TPA: lytic murein transglycosylase [Erwinia sp.]|uniref:lytic murein transglycosylase n=1 Tax=Erwinia citreus TaxID=558 RepID=UPI000E96778F|nr:lytic murein transglycosylase [Erwinia sp.]HBV38578.1 lytic murein transglycosylase [Erwinia sp.]
MKQPYFTLFISSLLLAGCTSHNSKALEKQTAAPAQSKTTLAATGRDPAEFPAYVDRLRQQAQEQGIDAATIDTAFSNIHFVDRAISADRNQLEKKVTLDDYLTRTLPEWKKQRARENAQQYLPQLQAVSQRYGVQPEYIVALWAMESSFGKIQGKEEIVSALATLAFEGRREAFFTKELMAALRIIQQQHLSPAQMKGSWAGAMGQNQFMPSSFLRYGADGDGDGQIDIWNNVEDVFASTANYLATEGWKPGERWGQEAILPADFVKAQAGLKTDQAKSVGEWQKLGVRFSDDAPLPDNAQRGWIILPDDAPGRAFMVYDNFRVIMHWNRSYYFAISIGMMADAISQQDVVH